MRTLRAPPILALPLLAVMLTSACEGDPAEEVGEPEQGFSVIRPTTLRARVHVGQRPVVGAQFTVRRLDAFGGGVIALGQTDAFGEIETPIALLAEEEEVELVVRKRGLTGLHSDDERRKQLGYFAPSSIQRVKVAQLASLELALEESGGVK